MSGTQPLPDDRQVSCPACHQVNRGSSKFCRQCGAELAQRSVNEVTKVAYVDDTSASVTASGVDCKACGASNKVSAKFCFACGSNLVEPAETSPHPAPVSPHVPEPAPDTNSDAAAERPAIPEPEPATLAEAEPAQPSYDQELVSKGQKMAVAWITGMVRRKIKATIASYLAIGAVAIVVISGLGYALWSATSGGPLEQDVLADASTSSGYPADAAMPTSLSQPSVPALQGVYYAHIFDQDVTLTVTGPAPVPLAELAGTFTYFNVVSGAGCAAALKPEAGSGAAVGLVASMDYRQTPIAGQTACPQPIPVKLAATTGSVTADGIIQEVQATWLSPDTGAVLMSGKLSNNGGR